MMSHGINNGTDMLILLFNNFVNSFVALEARGDVHSVSF